jgi:hypothetical protein
MTDTLKDFWLGLKARLEADADVDAWVADNFGGVDLRVKGSVYEGDLKSDELPACLIDADEGAPEPVNVGGKRQDEVAILTMRVAWKEPSVDLAFTQRLDLIDAVKKALMRDPGLGSAVTDARVIRWSREETQHPVHAVRFEIQGRYRLVV